MVDAWARVLARQAGVARRGQLRAAGLGTGKLRAQLSAGRWQALGDTVVVSHNGPLTRCQQLWAGVLACGNGAMLGGLTALEIDGLQHWAHVEVHVLTRRARSRSVLPGVPIVVHETRVDPGPGRVGRGAPARAAVARAAIDAASWRTDRRTPVAVCAAVVQQRLTTPERLKAALIAAGPIRHQRMLRLAIDDIAGGAEALSEIDFVGLVRRHRLGKVKGQVVRRDGQGRRRYIDGEIEASNGRRRRYEIDGGIHLQVDKFERDLDRQNELLIAGHFPLRFSSFGVRFEEPRVADQIRRALA